MTTVPTRNISLTDHYDGFIEDNLVSGEYKNASEVVRAGLAELERREEENQLKLDRLRAELDLAEKDIAVGRLTRIHNEAELSTFMDKIETSLSR